MKEMTLPTMTVEQIARALAALSSAELLAVRECLQPGTFARRVMGAWWSLNEHTNHLLSSDVVPQALGWKADAEKLRRELQLLSMAASRIMQHLDDGAADDEFQSCAICGLAPGSHEADEPCGELSRSLAELEAPAPGLPRAREKQEEEIQLLQSVAHAAGQHLAEHGNIQVKDPLHYALASYYRFVAERAKSKQAEAATGSDEGKARE